MWQDPPPPPGRILTLTGRSGSGPARSAPAHPAASQLVAMATGPGLAFWRSSYGGTRAQLAADTPEEGGGGNSGGGVEGSGGEVGPKNRGGGDPYVRVIALQREMASPPQCLGSLNPLQAPTELPLDPLSS